MHMSSQQTFTTPDATFTTPPTFLAEAIEQAQQAERTFEQRKAQITLAFLVVQALFCGYWMISWMFSGHYILGPVLAVVMWFVLALLYWPLSLLWYPSKRARDQAYRNANAARVEAGKAFMASQQLGAYRWVCRRDRMLGVFTESQMLYVLAPDSGNQHALMAAPRVVKQVRVDEHTTTSSTTRTTTKHGRRSVLAYTSFWGVIGPGTSRSKSTTTHQVLRDYTLGIQLQSAGQQPCWVELSFGEDRQEARNWQLLVEQTAGR